MEVIKYIATLSAGIALGVFITLSIFMFNEDPVVGQAIEGTTHANWEVTEGDDPIVKSPKPSVRHFIVSYSIAESIHGHCIINNDVFPPLSTIQKWILKANAFPKRVSTCTVIIENIFELNEADYITATIKGEKQVFPGDLKQIEHDSIN